MLKSWINNFEKELREKFVESKEVNAVGQNCVERDALYSTKEKKELRPNQACMNMYAKSNRDAEKAVRFCSGLGGRVLVPVDLTADALLDAILKQVSHRKDIYKAFQLRKQICYFMAKYPETFFPTIGGQFNLKTFNPQVNLVRLSSTTISIAEGQIREKEVVDTESTPIVKIESTPTVNITSTSQQSEVEPMDTTESETIPKDKPTTETDATESTPQDDLLVINIIEPDLSVVKTVTGDDDENQNMTFWLPPQQQVSITPYATPSTTQSQAASQLVPYPSAVYLAQQTAQRVVQQPAKVSVTPQGQSIRWG